MFHDQTTIQVNGAFKRSFFTPVNGFGRLQSVCQFLTRAVICFGVSTLIACSDSDSKSTSGTTTSKSSVGDSPLHAFSKEAFPNTNHVKPSVGVASTSVQAAAGLKITSPNEGEKWAVGAVLKLEWNKGSKGSHVIIKVYKSNKYVETITRKTKNDGSYSWKIPSSFKTGTTFFITITSFTYHNACATFSSYLTREPSHGRALVSTKTDTWLMFCTSSAGGDVAKDTCWGSCVSKYGSKNCEVVDVDGNNCTSTASAYDVSDNFTITKASGGGGSSLKVSTPNGGESWTTGKTQSIKWSKGTAGANVKIELLKSGKKSLTISKKTKNDGKHKWKIPSTVKTGSKYKIKITSSTKKTVTDSSDSNFTITKAGGGGDSSLKVSTPNGGESWTTGKSYDLKWSKGTAGANVKIELLKSGKKSLTISKKTKNDGKHKWKVPSSVKTGSKYKIKITSSTKKTVSDSSDSNFTITKAGGGGGGGGSSLKVSTPNGGESWTTGKTQSIKWSKGTAGANVKIELLKSGKKSLTISKKTKNDGKHSWKIPATVATASTYKIKITSSTKKTVTDSSDSNFTITKAAADTCSTKVRVGDPNDSTTYHSGKKVCLGKTPTDVVCGTTGGAGPNYWVTIKDVPKERLNIYACGSATPYWVHGWDSSSDYHSGYFGCIETNPDGWEIHPDECF
jgi:hypothetical protein